MKKKKPFLLKVLPAVFSLLEKINPRLAGKLALFLFLHPPRHKRPERENKCYAEAKKSSITVEGQKVAVFEWGEGPVVWVMHGWAGRATQLSSFISPLVKVGYKVIGIDAPAHGDSEGKESSVILYEKSLQALYQKYGKAHAYIGHSLGGAVGLFAMKNGIPFDKYVSISAPSIADLILHEAFDKIGATEKSIEAMCTLIEERVGAPFTEFTAAYWATFAPDIPYLIIHDVGDKEASIEHFNRLSSLLPNPQTHKTEGLGHVRILRDKEIVKEVVKFIKA